MTTVYDVLNFPLIDTANESLGSYKIPYLVFNSIEALIWILCALGVTARWMRHKRSGHELLYAVAFFAFGASDVIETFGTTLLLLLFKGGCLLAIIGFRAVVVPLYPGSKL